MAVHVSGGKRKYLAGTEQQRGFLTRRTHPSVNTTKGLPYDEDYWRSEDPAHRH